MSRGLKHDGEYRIPPETGLLIPSVFVNYDGIAGAKPTGRGDCASWASGPDDGGTIEYFRDTVFNYPTLAEAYKVAALDGLNKL